MSHPIRPTTTTVQAPPAGRPPVPSGPGLSRIMASLLCLVTMALPLSACKQAPLPPPVALFDQGHGQHFLVENKGELDLSQLGEAFTGQGFQVKASAPDQALTDEALARVSTLIISGAFKPITDPEIAVINKFINQGGQLCVMLHIGSPFANLLNSMGVAVSNGVIREQANAPQPDKATDFYVTDLAPHPLTKGITRINLYGSWALNTEHPANVIARTTPQAWVDLNSNQNLDPGDATQAFSVVVTGQLGHGHFIVFGDDAIFQNRFLVGANRQLATNLASWLQEERSY